MKKLFLWLWGEECPPSSWAKAAPWWLLHIIDKHTKVCWTGVAMWKMGYEWSWFPSDACFKPHDYCGKFGEEAIRRMGHD